MLELGESLLEFAAFATLPADTIEGCREVFSLLAPLGREGLADFFLQSAQLLAVKSELLRRVHGDLARARRGEDAVEGVEVGLANRIELMVVATGARDCQSEECFAHDVNLVVDVTYLFVEGVDGLEAVFD